MSLALTVVGKIQLHWQDPSTYPIVFLCVILYRPHTAITLEKVFDVRRDQYQKTV